MLIFRAEIRLLMKSVDISVYCIRENISNIS